MALKFFGRLITRSFIEIRFVGAADFADARINVVFLRAQACVQRACFYKERASVYIYGGENQLTLLNGIQVFTELHNNAREL